MLACSLEESHDEGPQLHAVAAQLGAVSDLGHQALQDPGGRTCRKWETRKTLALDKTNTLRNVLKKCFKKSGRCVTGRGRRLHHAPGVVPPLADDEVQLVVPQAVLQNVLHGGT